MEKISQNRDIRKKQNFLQKFFTKIFLGIFVSISFFMFGSTVSNVNAETDSNWSSSGFTIQLDQYDPIKHNAKGTGITGETSGGDWKGIIQRLLEKLSNLMLMIIPILGAVSLIIAGYFYIFSFSDEENVTKAKTIIKYNLLAMVVAFGSWAIISTIASFFK